jgi:hypothetical protein
MSAQIHAQGQNQSQWSSVLGHYGAAAYQTSEVSPTNTTQGEMRSPPPAYTTIARSQPKLGPTPSSRPQPRPRRNSTAVPPASAQNRSSVRTRTEHENNMLSIDESISRAMSLAFGNSTSSSGTDDLDSPPIETETDTTADTNVSIRTSSSRPSMRHFPSVSVLQRRGQSNSGDEDEDEGEGESYPRRMLHRDDLIGKPVSRKYMTVTPTKSKASLKLDVWWNTSGKNGSKLMSKLKSGGSRLSRLFSSDGEMASEGSGSSDGQDEMTRQSTVDNPRTAAELTRRPSLSIDLSGVPTFQTELLTAQVNPPRIPTPSFVLGRHGFSRYNPLPTIVGSPSIPTPLSPVDIFHTPRTGLSPVFASGFPAEVEGPRSLVGLFQTPCPIPVLTTRSSEATVVTEAMITPTDSETMEVEGASGETKPVSTTPPITEDVPMVSTSTPEEAEVNLSIFSPRVHYTPVLLPVLGSPMCSPLELPSLDSPVKMKGSVSASLTPGSTSSGSGLGLGAMSGSMMLSNSASRSHSSNGSIRIKIDGNPKSASLTGMAASLISEQVTAATSIAPAPAPAIDETLPPARPFLARGSVDVNVNRPIFTASTQTLRQSLPDITSPTSPPRTFSPMLGATSPRTPESPHFTRPDFGPVSTPPSLIANPRSLGDPFPKGVPTSSSRNLAAMANPEQVVGLGHLRRRSSGRIIDRYGRGPLSPPRKLSTVEPTSQASESTESTIVGSPTAAKAAVPLNPYFG